MVQFDVTLDTKFFLKSAAYIDIDIYIYRYIDIYIYRYIDI